MEPIEGPIGRKICIAASALLLIFSSVIGAQSQIFEDGFEFLGPIIISTPVTEAEVGELYSYDVDAIDLDGDALMYALLVSPAGMGINATTGEITWTATEAGPFPVTVEVTDGVYFAEQSWTITVVQGPPPEPVPSEIDPTVVTAFPTFAEFLYEGPDAIQQDVQPDAFEAHRVSVIRGTVTDRAGTPLEGAKVSALRDEAIGYTRTRADGAFDLAVNGGGEVVIEVELAGYLTTHRHPQVPWNDFRVLEPIRLVPLSNTVTTVTLSPSKSQLAQGDMETDSDGARQGTLVFQPGTTAELVMPDGSTQPINSMDVRITEFTVGANGPDAMPAELPPTSGYTYAAEYSIDEVAAMGAESVTFDPPVASYLENFLSIPVGIAVPTGAYDRKLGQWRAARDGIVLEIVGITSGAAELDIDGDGIADDASSIGVTAEELEELAALYPVGQQLWRVEVSHFTPWDHNWPTRPPPGAKPPRPEDGPRENGPDPEDDCPESGFSFVDCQSQVLREAIPVVGTNQSLHYRSDRAKSFSAGRTLKVSIPASEIPDIATHVLLSLEIAGTQQQQTFPTTEDIETSFIWDGTDAYGRQVYGPQPYTMKISFAYEAVYAQSSGGGGGGGSGGGASVSFFGQPGVAIEGQTRGALEIFISRTFTGTLSAQHSTHGDLGGWTLTEHHTWAPQGRGLFLGDGTIRKDRAGFDVNVIRTWECHQDFCFDGPLEDAPITSRNVEGISAAPLSDGSVVLAVEQGDEIWQVRPDETMTHVLTPEVTPPEPSLLTPLPDDSFLFMGKRISSDQFLVIRANLDGEMQTVFGGGSTPLHSNLDYVGPATDLFMDDADYRFQNLAAAPDGSIYVAVRKTTGGTSGFTTIWHVSPDGTAQRVAGTYTSGAGPGNGGPALDAEIELTGLTLAPNGDIWLTERRNHQVRRISGGIIDRVIGTGNCNSQWLAEGPVLTTNLCRPDEIDISPNGTIFISSFVDGGSFDHERFFRSDGERIELFAGGQDILLGAEDGAIALGGALGSRQCYSFYYLPSGRVLCQQGVGAQITIFVGPVLGDIDNLGTKFIPSSDGRLIYEFDASGRHQKTIDTFLDQDIRTFGYDPEGRLTTITDLDGRVTTIQRSGSGVATAIIGPDGHQTLLTISDGLLTEVTNPAGDTHTFNYGPGGELTSITDPRGNTSSYVYNAEGLLEQATSRGGGVLTLERTQLGIGRYEVAVTVHGTETRVQRVETEGPDLVRTLIDPTGAETTVRMEADGSIEGTFPDGTTATYRSQADPRFGASVRHPEEFTATTPNNITSTTTYQFDATLTDVADPRSMTNWTETRTRDGQSTVFEYDVASRTLTSTSPEGRIRTEIYDQSGRIVSYHPGGGIAPVDSSYDSNGRLTSISQAGEVLTLAYDGDGNLISATDDGGGVTTWTHDDAGRIESVMLPSGRLYDFTLDANGNRTAVTLPEVQVHTLSYDANDRLSSYTFPAANTHELIMDGLGRREGVTYPDGTNRDDLYVDGQVVGATLPDSVLSVQYAPETDGGVGFTSQIDLVARNPASRPEQALSFDLDGRLVLGQSMVGPATASVTYTYNRPYQPDSRTFESEAPITFSYDSDSLLTGIGPFTVSREPDTGLQNSITDGTLTLDIGLDSRVKLVSRDLLHGMVAIQQLTLTRDERGRIANRLTTVDSTTSELSYEYDVDGRLVAVTDGMDNPVESFAYDGNDNRTSHTTTGGTENATYNDQDQIIMRGGIAYSYDSNGFLAMRGADSFDYASDGGLMTATVGGVTVTYDHDYYGRRVARTDAGGTTTYVYGDLAHPFRITASVAPDSTVSEYLYDDSGALFAFRRGGVWYYVGTDHVGSPRVVVEGLTGTVVKTVEYSAFGEALADSDPSFVLPVGFAGGLPDPATELVRFGLRDYEPVAGRFTGRDPLLLASGSPNLYAYVDNDPVNYRDLTGLFVKIGGSAYAGFGGGVSVVITSQGLGFCAEGGVGAGGGMELEPFAGLPEAGFSAVGAGSYGPIGTGFEVPFDDCWASGRPDIRWDGVSLASERASEAADPLLGEIFDQAGKETNSLIEGINSKAVKNVAKRFKGFGAEANLSVRGCLPPLVW